MQNAAKLKVGQRFTITGTLICDGYYEITGIRNGDYHCEKVGVGSVHSWMVSSIEGSIESGVVVLDQQGDAQ